MRAIDPPPSEDIRRQVAQALAEDIGSGDVTALLIAESVQAHAHLLCRQSAILCGRPWVDATIRAMQADIDCEWHYNDGDRLTSGSIVADFRGNARALLTAERTLLNFLQTLSATASRTQRYVAATAGHSARILDTRKTLPGLRSAQKYAVRCGGGENHRHGLFDAFLIKENHIRASGGIGAAIARARASHPKLLVEIEVETLQELQQAIDSAPDRILLDNFAVDELAAAVALCGGRVPLEASGGITLSDIGRVAATGVDYISLGTLTKDIEAVDFSLLFV